MGPFHGCEAANSFSPVCLSLFQIETPMAFLLFQIRTEPVVIFLPIYPVRLGPSTICPPCGGKAKE